MSSATSTDPSTPLGARPPTLEDSQGFRPWQFFLLAGMLAATATVIVATGQSPASIIFLSVTIVAAGLVGFGVYRTLAPLVAPETVEAQTLAAGRTRAALEREKALALRSIKELEFDFAMGKVSKVDFDEMSARLRSRAIRLMRQLEEGGGYRGVIEKELQARIGTHSEAPAFSRGTVGPDNCASCGTTNDSDARFCKNCGAKLSRADRPVPPA